MQHKASTTVFSVLPQNVSL